MRLRELRNLIKNTEHLPDDTPVLQRIGPHEYGHSSVAVMDFIENIFTETYGLSQGITALSKDKRLVTGILLGNE
jgi:hypothetical protein